MNRLCYIVKPISSAVLCQMKRRIVSSVYPTLNIAKQNFTNYFLNIMKQYPERIAMIDGLSGRKYSYGELELRIHSIASALTTRGLKRGDKVGMLATNSVDYLAVYMATIGCGATIVSFNPSYSKYELQPLLSMTRPKFVFSNSGPLKNILPSMVTTFVERMYNMDSDPIPGVTSVNSLADEGSSHSPINDESSKSPDDISVIIFSSGTTGHPKGVPLTNTNLLSTAIFLDHVKSVADNSVLISILPMYHIYGVLVSFMIAIQSGSVSVILPSFNPITFLQAIQKYQISHLHLVPPILLFLINHEEVKKYDISSVSKITSGAAVVDIKLEEKIANHFLPLNSKFVFGQGYGLSESSGIITFRPHTRDVSIKKSGSVGLLLSNQQMKVLSTETGEEVGANQLGEICIKGPNIMNGYCGVDEDINANSFIDGFFRSGDLGYYDDDQYVYLCDRIKELIKVKGYQVAPAELEALLLSHPSIRDCAVVGVPHDTLGEVPRAFVVKSKEITESEIQIFVEENLSSYKHLKGGVHFLDSIPKSASGKILRKLLKKP